MFNTGLGNKEIDFISKGRGLYAEHEAQDEEGEGYNDPPAWSVHRPRYSTIVPDHHCGSFRCITLGNLLQD